MKKFLFDILIGFIAFVCFWGVAEYVFSQHDVVNSYSYKYNYVKNNPAIKTLLIGNSHFENSVNPYLMGDSVFDFAISGRWIYWDVLLAKQMYPTMPNLKTVIIPTGYATPYWSLHYKKFREIDKEYAFKYAKNMHLYYDVFPDNMILSSALITNKMGLKYWIDEEVDSLGYDMITGHEENFDNHNVSPDVMYSSRADLSFNEYISHLREIARICQENNIRFIAVTCPCADSYVRNTRPAGIQKLHDLMDSVRAYYPIEYYNYLNDPEFREDSLYYNCSHLNSIGADKFAIRLKNDLGL